MNKKTLSLPILISLVVGNTIGTGIFVLPASLAEYGTISIFSWIYTSIGALLLALVFARLSNRFPKSGGPYIYCKEAFGNLAGFVIAYTYWISNLVCIAAIAVSAIGYLGFITPALNSASDSYNPNLALLFELAAVWLFTLINILGLQTAGKVQILLTLIKLSPLFLVILIGFSHIQYTNLIEFTPAGTSHFSALSSAAALTFWAFIGLESATVAAESSQSSRDIFKATVYGTMIAALVYILSTIVLMGMIPIAELKNLQFPFAYAGTELFGRGAALLIAICAVISGLGALNVCILIQGQIVYAAARDRLFPMVFANTTTTGTPLLGQLLSSTLISILLISTMQPSLLEQFTNIALLGSLLTLIAYFVTALSELKFILINSSLAKALMSQSMLVTSLAAAYVIWMISSLDLKILSIGVSLILICIPFYFLLIKKSAQTEGAG